MNDTAGIVVDVDVVDVVVPSIVVDVEEVDDVVVVSSYAVTPSEYDLNAPSGTRFNVTPLSFLRPQTPLA